LNSVKIGNIYQKYLVDYAVMSSMCGGVTLCTTGSVCV